MHKLTQIVYSPNSVFLWVKFDEIALAVYFKGYLFVQIKFLAWNAFNSFIHIVVVDRMIGVYC